MKKIKNPGVSNILGAYLNSLQSLDLLISFGQVASSSEQTVKLLLRREIRKLAEFWSKTAGKSGGGDTNDSFDPSLQTRKVFSFN